MPARTVFLIRSDSPNWTGLRAALDGLADVMVVGDTASAAVARRQVPALRPNLIVSAIDVEGTSAVPLLVDLHAALPAALLVVIAGRYTPEELLGLARLNLTGYFLWDDLEDSAFAAAHAAVRSGVFAVGSRTVATAFFDAVFQRRTAGDSLPTLSIRERAVLHRLADGMTRPRIAEAEGISRRTVERVISELQTKLDAPTAFLLGMKESRYGFTASPGGTDPP